MNFSRSLLSTMQVAAFGAIVLAGTGGGAGLVEPATMGGALPHDPGVTADAFRRVFLADAACLAIALVAIAMMAERPLQEEPPGG
jgi:hypothetical protein